MTRDATPEASAPWDVSVSADRPWWQLGLGEVWRYRDLLMLLVRRDLIAVYKQTVLGPAWQVLQPLLTSIMFAVVFGLMARMSLPGIPPLLFYMSALVPWGDRLLGAVFTACAFVLWGRLRPTRVSARRHRPPVTS